MTVQVSVRSKSSRVGPRHEVGGFCGDWAAGGFWSFRAALRASIHTAASVSFSDTSRKNFAVRFSVSGATSSFTKLFTRVSSSSTRFPKSSKLWMLFMRENSSSMRSRELLVDAFAELLEFVHGWGVLGKFAALRRTAATSVL